jgi:hypothetical protein
MIKMNSDARYDPGGIACVANITGCKQGFRKQCDYRRTIRLIDVDNNEAITQMRGRMNGTSHKWHLSLTGQIGFVIYVKTIKATLTPGLLMRQD